MEKPPAGRSTDRITLARRAFAQGCLPRQTLFFEVSGATRITVTDGALAAEPQ